jgi:tetratricopeptide (TPR) repeat protein
MALTSKAEIHAILGHDTEVEKVLGRLDEVAPETSLGSFGKGRLYKSQEKYAEALAQFEKAYEKNPDSTTVLAELIETELAAGDVDGAIRRLKDILETDPENRIAHGLLGTAYMAKEDYAAAEAEFSRQVTAVPDSAGVYLYLAESRTRQGNAEGAIQAYRQGLEALPDNVGLLSALAGSYAAQGDLEQAAAMYQKGLEVAPDNQRLNLGLAGVRERQGRFDDSIAVYEKVLEANPDNIIATNNLAVILAEQKQDEQSLKKARELAAALATYEQPPLQDTIGWVYYHSGDYDKAVAVLKAVVEKMPDVPVFNYHLGMAYYRQGDTGSAKAYLSKAVDEQYSYPGVEEARQVLSKL